MIKWTCNEKFHCAGLNRYIEENENIYEYESSAKIALETGGETYPFTNINEVEWFDDVAKDLFFDLSISGLPE